MCLGFVRSKRSRFGQSVEETGVNILSMYILSLSTSQSSARITCLMKLAVFRILYCLSEWRYSEGVYFCDNCEDIRGSNDDQSHFGLDTG